MIKKIAVSVVALLVVLAGGLLILAANKPDTFRVQRATSIDAPPEEIFALIDDFHSWGAWSPYEKKDPAMKRTLSGAESGKGAVYEWEGDSNVGKGRMEITESSPPSKVAIALDFAEPFEAHNIVEFTLVPEGAATRVTWGMQGPAPFVSKIMQVFFDMDSMVGKDFEVGLANLKTLAER